MKLRRAVFLDRDGTIILDTGYLSNPSEIALLPNAAEALRKLHQHGFLLVLISNQSGVGRDLFTLKAMDEVHNQFMDCLHKKGIDLDGVYYCPHAPWNGCECRKPLPGMLHQAVLDLDVNLTWSFMVGDKLSDVAAGKRAGCQTVLLGDFGRDIELNGNADHVAPDLLAAAQWILMRTGDKPMLEGYRVG